MDDFKAAIKTGDSWQLTDNAEKILDSQEVIYVTDIESLEFELGLRHPAPEGFKFLETGRGYGSSIRVHEAPIAKVDTEPAVIFEYAREHGSVKLGDNKKIEFEPSTSRSQVHIASDEFYSTGYNRGTLIYDPKKVKGTRSRRRGTKKGRINKGVPSVSEIRALERVLSRSLSQHPAMKHLCRSAGNQHRAPQGAFDIMKGNHRLAGLSKLLWGKRKYRDHEEWESVLATMKPYIPSMKDAYEAPRAWLRIARWLEVEVRMHERQQEAKRKAA